MLLADDVVLAVIDEHLAGEDGFLVIGSHAGAKAAVGGLDVPEAMIDPYDDGVILPDDGVHDVVHNSSLSALWAVKMFGYSCCDSLHERVLLVVTVVMVVTLSWG